MSDPRVIQAEFTSFRTVNGRKVVQLLFEVPIEETEHTLKMLGVPIPGQSKWCAVALLDKTIEQGRIAQRIEPRDSTSEVVGSNPAAPAKQRTPWNELKPSAQAAIRCAEPAFQRWIMAKDRDEAADNVRMACGIASRAEIVAGSIAGKKWSALERDYQAHLTTQQYADIKR